MPRSQRDKLRYDSIPLLGNNVAVFDVAGDHLHRSVGRMDCCFEVATSTAELCPDSSVNGLPYAGRMVATTAARGHGPS